MESWTSLFPALAGAPAPLLAQIAALPVLHLPAGTVVFDEGAVCAGFPLLLSGAIRVDKYAANGRALHLYRVLPGESCVITQSCLLGRQRYGARGRADCDLALKVLPIALFEALIAAHPTFREFVFALFGERFSELMALIDEVAFKRLDQRLAGLLVERGPLLRCTHQALADDLASVREIVTRLLRQFADEGLVELAREQIRVLDPAQLAQRA